MEEKKLCVAYKLVSINSHSISDPYQFAVDCCQLIVTANAKLTLAKKNLEQQLKAISVLIFNTVKVEEGMSSGGSTGMPATPAPTPFSIGPSGIRPEDLVAGISRLSVIQEQDTATIARWAHLGLCR